MKRLISITASSLTIAIAQLTAAPAMAQSANAASAEQQAAEESGAAPAETEAITVTGTRLRTNGFDAPVPTQIVGIAEIQLTAPKMIDDFLNSIPSISGSMSLRSRGVQASNGTNGISSPSLRSIGTNRTLVLLDGQRSVAVTQTGETDVLSFPSQLIQRVDVVTGGASALYGSDALAGVVNFVLDKRFTGFKVEAQGGITTYGDDRNYKFAGTYGKAFAGDRGHFVVSGEYQWNQGVGRDYNRIVNGRPPKRDWNYGSPQLITNPAYNRVTNPSVPQLISSFNGSTLAGPAGSTPGGLITSGPLKGTAFTNAGTPYAFQYGQVDASNLYMIGGDWQKSDINALSGLDPFFKRLNIFARADYDVTDTINLFVQYQHSDSEVYGNFSSRIWQGSATPVSTGGLVLKSDNAFLRQALAGDPARLALLNTVASVNFGTVSEAEALGGAVNRKFDRFVFGGKGNISLGEKTFDWNFYFQHGQSKAHEQIPGSHNVDHFNKAIDAVVNPANNQIVCRSTLTDPTNGCVPLNLIGYDGQVDPAALAYSYGRPTRDQKFTQDVFSADLAGELFNLPAGPVSFAIGGEHRRERVVGTVDAISQQGTTTLPNGQADVLHGWSTNFIPVNGKYHVTEGFVEVSLPLLKDSALGRSLVIDGAARATQYSTSGYVTTWKTGLSYEPVEGVRFRASRSRDIRAPSMSELFTKGLFITTSVNETVNGVTLSYPQNISFTTGNLDLKPEKADNLGLGIVLQPAFLPRFSFSADWYKIKIKDAIGTVPVQTIVNQCSLGNTLFCSAIERTNGAITRVNVQPFNFASQEFKGIDFEASYTFPILAGNISLRAFATRYLKAVSNDGISPELNYLGDMGANLSTPAIGNLPKFKYRLAATYDSESFAINLTGRGVGAGVWGNNQIGCLTDCPAVFPAGIVRTVDNNRAPGTFYLDTTLTIRPMIGGKRPEFFISAQNVFNKDPVILPRPAGGLAGAVATNPAIYDTLGRVFSVGVRTQF